MEIALSIVTFFLIAALALCPVLILRITSRADVKPELIIYLVAGIIASALFSVAAAWWFSTADLILLKHYGYNISGMDDKEMYENVLPQNMQSVKKLETRIMGVGWPLQALFVFVLSLSYLFIVYLIGHLIKEKKP